MRDQFVAFCFCIKKPAACILFSGPSSRFPRSKNAEGEWAELMHKVLLIRAVPYLMKPNRGVLDDKETPNSTPLVLMTG